MVGGALLFGAVMLAHLLASSLAILIVLRLLLGVAEALVFVAAFAAEADLAPPERRGEALTLFSLSLYVGIAVGPLIGEAAFDGGRLPRGLDRLGGRSPGSPRWSRWRCRRRVPPMSPARCAGADPASGRHPARPDPDDRACGGWAATSP